MPVRTALAILLIAGWDAWQLLAGRVEDSAGIATALVLLGALGWRLWRMPAHLRMPAPLLATLLVLYAITAWTGPALLQIGMAVIAVTITACSGCRPAKLLPITCFALLLLPVLPTLDFLLAYPLRRVSALIATTFLRLNGVGVGVEGVALEWHGQRLLFDGPCSGVKMLWAALLLASLLALAQGAGVWRYLRLLALATAAAVLGNALRAASLFYLENGFVPALRGPIAHEAVGVMAFLMIAIVMLAATRRARWSFS